MRFRQRRMLLPLGIERAEYDGSDDWVYHSTAATDNIVFDAIGPGILTPAALESIGRWLTTKRTTMFVDHDRRDRMGKTLTYEVTGSNPTRLRTTFMVSKTRPDIRTQIEEGVIPGVSIWFIPDPSTTERVQNDEVGGLVYEYGDGTVGMEQSVVGMPADTDSTIDLTRDFSQGRWSIARKVGGLPMPVSCEGFSLVQPFADASLHRGGEFRATSWIPMPGHDEAVLRGFAATLCGGAMLRGGPAGADPGHVEDARVERGGILITTIHRGCGAADLERFQSVVLRGLKGFDQDKRLVALSFEYGELSNETIARSVEDDVSEDQTPQEDQVPEVSGDAPEAAPEPEVEPEAAPEVAPEPEADAEPAPEGDAPAEEDAPEAEPEVAPEPEGDAPAEEEAPEAPAAEAPADDGEPRSAMLRQLAELGLEQAVQARTEALQASFDEKLAALKADVAEQIDKIKADSAQRAEEFQAVKAARDALLKRLDAIERAAVGSAPDQIIEPPEPDEDDDEDRPYYRTAAQADPESAFAK